MVEMNKIFLVNEKLYFAKGLKILLQQIIHGAIQINRGKKTCPICFDFSFVHSWPPLIEYTKMQKLFMQLNVFNNPIQNIGLMGASWEMEDCTCKQVLKGT
jgi:hypothetical protein